MNQTRIWKILVSGETVLEQEKRCVGQAPTSLSDTSKDKLIEVRNVLRRSMIDHVYCSDMQQAIETYNVVKSEKIPDAVFTESLRERSCGKWDGVPLVSIKKELGPRTYCHWNRDVSEVPALGESIVNAKQRFVDWMNEIDNTGTTLFVTHPDMARAIILEARKDMSDKIMKTNIEHATIYSMIIK